MPKSYTREPWMRNEPYSVNFEKTWISAGVPPDMKERFKARAAELEIPMSQLLRQLIEKYLDNK